MATLVWPRSEAYKSRATADTPSFQQFCICTWTGFGFVHRSSIGPASALKLYIANLDYNRDRGVGGGGGA